MTSTNPEDLAVENNEAGQRFEIRAPGGTAVLNYAMEDGRIVLIHTEVPKALEGRGLGSKLASTALAWARDHRLKVVPYCPYVQGWLQRHREFDDIVLPEAQP